MSEGQHRQGTCAEVDERMAEILDGSAPDYILDHIAECDGCRDARYDAERNRDLVTASGADYVPAADLEARILTALDRRSGRIPGSSEAATPVRPSGEAAPAQSAEVSNAQPSSGARSADAPEAMRALETAETMLSAPPRSEPEADVEARGPTTQPLPDVKAPAPQNRTELMPDTRRTDPGVGPTLASGTEEMPAAPVMPEAAPVAHQPAPEPIPAPAAPEPVTAQPRKVKLPSGKKRWLLIGGGGAGAALAAAAIALIAIKVHKGQKPEIGSESWYGNVDKVAGAGFEICAPDGKSCAKAAEKGAIPKGSVLTTDGQTRARVTLADGTELSLDKSTKLALNPSKPRWAKLESGNVVLDVAHIEGKTAWIGLPKGHVEVLGTKLSLTATPDSSTVTVTRGSVKLVDAEGRDVTVRAGEEGRSYAGTPPFVSAAPSLGETVAWSESAIAESDKAEAAVRGLGELKAKKPGESNERSNAVSLTSHAVKVRIAGAMARTEVEEVFNNNTDEVLEGIFRFPVPPDAKIERLALEVDGKLEEGAFVDRDRASAIWRGAIVNTAPQLRQQIREEIVWVPGPWKDPALLEWQRGGRFELRIFPIPKRGARRVILAYTQVIKPTGGVRRYNYPLAHDPSGSTKVGRFDVDVWVRGHDEAFGVRSQGYELAKNKSQGADQLTMNASSFVPSGDLTIEYALENRNAELTAWAYKPSADDTAKIKSKANQPPPPVKADNKKDAVKPASLKTVAPAPVAEAPKTPEDAPYVALALRPKLPRSREGGQRTFAIVVDSSRSMFGESYKRASLVATKLIRELDRGDSFTVLACDASCRVMPGGAQIPSAQAAVEVERFLASITPDGASDPTAAVRSAKTAANAANAKDLHVVYIGDGTPTVGAIRPAYVTHAVEQAIPPGSGNVTTVAIGADSDADTLGAMARGGGGVMLPFVPGQTSAEAVYAVLGASYGTTLRDVTVELPAGLSEVSPKKLDTFVNGSEEILVARMSQPAVEGTVVVRGKLGKENWEQRYPVKVAATESKGNAFVPRLFAATRIADLEREAAADSKKEAIRLSSAFDVASRFTSLLVLESEAMFKAFGLDNTRTSHQWTGEEIATAATAQGEKEVEGAEDEAKGDAYADKDSTATGRARGPVALSGEAEGGGGFGRGSSGGSVAPAKPAAKSPAPGFSQPSGTAAPAPPAEPRPAEEKSKKSEIARDDAWDAPRASRRPAPNTFGGGRRMIPMRRIFERKGSVLEGRQTPKTATLSTIAIAERDVETNPNRRDSVKKLHALLQIAGDTERARSLAERWSEKEPLDPEALTARADIAARSGDRESAIRLLGSVVDVRPDDIPAQKRLARLHRWAGRAADGCRHTLALAQLRSGDASLLAEAASCGRRTGESRMVDDMFAAVDEKLRKVAETQVAKFDSVKDELSGDLRVEANWFGGDSDVDIALIDPDGNRVSWLGAPTKAVITATDVVSTSREGLALRGAKVGEYVVEVVRAQGGAPVRGDVTITVAGAKKTIPFNLAGTRETVGIAKISLESRLVPVDRGFWE